MVKKCEHIYSIILDQSDACTAHEKHWRKWKPKHWNIDIRQHNNNDKSNMVKTSHHTLAAKASKGPWWPSVSQLSSFEPGYPQSWKGRWQKAVSKKQWRSKCCKNWKGMGRMDNVQSNSCQTMLIYFKLVCAATWAMFELHISSLYIIDLFSWSSRSPWGENT